jgi:hypothetical protein
MGWPEANLDCWFNWLHRDTGTLTMIGRMEVLNPPRFDVRCSDNIDC